MIDHKCSPKVYVPVTPLERAGSLDVALKGIWDSSSHPHVLWFWAAVELLVLFHTQPPVMLGCNADLKQWSPHEQDPHTIPHNTKPGQLCCELVIKIATNLGENSFSFNKINEIRSLSRPVASLHHLCPLILIQISSFVPTVGKLSFDRLVQGPQNPNVFSLSTQILVHHIFPVAHGHFWKCKSHVVLRGRIHVNFYSMPLLRVSSLGEV